MSNGLSARYDDMWAVSEAGADARHAAASWFDGHPVDVRGRPGAMSDMTTSLGLRP